MVIKGLATLLLGLLLIPSLIITGTLTAANGTLAEPNYYINLMEKHQVLSAFKTEMVKSFAEHAGQTPRERAMVEQVISATLSESWFLTQARSVVSQAKKALGGTGPAVIVVPVKELKDALITEAKKAAQGMDVTSITQGLNSAIPDALDLAKSMNWTDQQWQQARRYWHYRIMTVPVALGVCGLLALLVWLVWGATRRSTVALGVMTALGGAGLLVEASVGAPKLIALITKALPQPGAAPSDGPLGTLLAPLQPSVQTALIHDAVGGMASRVTLAGAVVLGAGFILMFLLRLLGRTLSRTSVPPERV